MSPLLDTLTEKLIRFCEFASLNTLAISSESCPPTKSLRILAAYVTLSDPTRRPHGRLPPRIKSDVFRPSIGSGEHSKARAPRSFAFCCFAATLSKPFVRQLVNSFVKPFVNASRVFASHCFLVIFAILICL